MPQQRQRLAHFLAEADAQREAHETEEKTILRVHRRPVGKADELDEVEDQDEDAAAGYPEALRPVGQHLKQQQEQDADGGGEQTETEQVQRFGRLLRSEQDEESHEQNGGAGGEAPMSVTIVREKRAHQLVIGKGGEQIGARGFAFLHLVEQLDDAQLHVERRLFQRFLELFLALVFAAFAQERKSQRQQGENEQPVQMPQPERRFVRGQRRQHGHIVLVPFRHSGRWLAPYPDRFYLLTRRRRRRGRRRGFRRRFLLQQKSGDVGVGLRDENFLPAMGAGQPFAGQLVARLETLSAFTAR
jgi:hypothetical protein